MNDNQIKKTVMVFLFLAIFSLAIGFAILTQGLNINGSASITSLWKVEIIEMNIVDSTTGAKSISYSNDNTVASFNVELTQPGDYIEYEVKVKNNGTLNATLKSITRSVNNNDAIIFTTSGLAKDDDLLVGQTKTIKVKISYADSITSQPKVTQDSLKIELNFEQK